MRMSEVGIAALCIVGAAAAQGKSPESVLQSIAALQKDVPPELWRYRELTFFGETISRTRPSAAAVASQLSLLADAKAAGLFATMPEQVRALGHDVIVHSPTKAADYFTALCALGPGGDKKLGSDLYCATMAFGEAGERSAVAGLRSDRVETRRYWIRFLAANAIQVSTGKEIERRIAEEKDEQVRAGMLRALSSVGMPTALPIAKKIAEMTKSDDEQAGALFTCVELGGFDAIEFVQKVKPVGPHATSEQEEGLGYLKRETSAKSKHGREVASDAEFVARFGDLHDCPTIAWLAEQKLLEDDAVKNPPKLDDAQKKRLFELLLDSKGFALEAVKGAVFVSLAKSDEATLLELRARSFWSPNPMSSSRVHTLDILVRHLRQEL